MKRQLKSSNTDHTGHDQDKVDRPNLDPIRDDPEPLIAPVKEPPRKEYGGDEKAGAAADVQHQGGQRKRFPPGRHGRHQFGSTD